MDRLNPYYNTAGINNSQLFFNRINNIRDILNSLSSGQSWSILGQRRIGKTSLIEHLARPMTRANLGFSGLNAIFVYFNCQVYPMALKSTSEFLRTIFELLYDEVPEDLRKLVWDSSFDINMYENDDNKYWLKESLRVLKKIAKQDFQVVLMFDEFEKAIMQEDLFKDALFDTLRGLSMHPSTKFSWIACTVRSLNTLFQEVFNEYKVPTSVRINESEFVNISRPHVLGLLEERYIRDLIVKPSQDRGINFLEEDIQTIIRFGGRFPYFIQLACCNFFNAYVESNVQGEEVIKRCISESQSIWEGFWNKLDVAEQKDLFHVAIGYPVTNKKTILSLREMSLIYEQDDKLYPFSEEFGNFVLTKDPSSGMTIQVGQRLDGKYEVLNVAGKTGHSQVVKAWDFKLNRYVAVKLIYVSTQSDSDSIQKLHNNLLREANIQSMLDGHPNIGKVYAAIEEPLGVVMEWIEGSPLQDIIDDHEYSVLVREVVDIGMKLADALDFAHTRGTVHRDIKPSNIVLKHNGEPVLIDFDIARSASLETITRLTDGSAGYVGTRKYSAPEQLYSPELAGPAVDLFALGVVIYQLLTHQLPYPLGNNRKNYAEQRLPQPNPVDIPAPLYAILCELLNELPERRPSAAELRATLKTYLDSLGEHDADSK
jgi:predicted Ser/Thr protein kinase